MVEFINDFQIKELPVEESVKEAITKHNAYAKQELPKSEMIQFYDLLLKYGSFKEVGKYSCCSRATIVPL